MLKGSVFISSACFLWGLIFLVPLCLPEFNAFQIAFGRYFFFGIASLFFLNTKNLNIFKISSSHIWLSAILVALLSSFLHYSAAVGCMRYADPTLSALILGLSPVCMMLLSKKQLSPFSWQQTLFSALLIVCSLPLLHYSLIQSQHFKMAYYPLGLMCGVFALATWVAFLMINGYYLNKYSEMKSLEWTSMVGFSSLLLSILAFICIPKHFLGYQCLLSSKFLLGSCVLGVGSSWLASYFWNRGTTLVPLSIASPMIILETVFGIIFVHLFEKRFPQKMELMGILLVISTIYFNLRACQKKTHPLTFTD